MPISISAELIRFLVENGKLDPRQLVLAGKDICGYPPAFVAEQLRARQHQQRRLPSWCAENQVVFPPSINLEQSSSESTALRKAALIKEWSANRKPIHMADLTAGFGVDSVAFSTVFERLSVVDPDAQLLELNQYNFGMLGRCEAEFLPLPAEEFLASSSSNPDWLYLDPSRRRDGQRVNHLSDGEPDAVGLLNRFWNNRPSGDRPNILLKTAPMMDITEALRILPQTKHVAVVSVDNECREVLYHLAPDGQPSPERICLNLKSSGEEERFEFSEEEEHTAMPAYAGPMRFLFEPNASILKAGAIRLIAVRHGLYRMDDNTQLLTGDIIPTGFPGRIFEVIRPLGKKETGLHADVLVRNHPLHPNELARHFAFHEGGPEVVVAFRSRKGKHVLLTRRVAVKESAKE